MKKALMIPLLALLLLTPRAFKASALEQNPDGASPPETPAAQKVDPYTEGDDDIFSSAYEREMLSRRFFQKILPPLKPREKIAWAFKTSKASILL